MMKDAVSNGRAATKSDLGANSSLSISSESTSRPHSHKRNLPAMLLRILLVLASAFICVQSGHYELYSDLSEERWFLDDSKLIPISCQDGDCSPMFNKYVKHKIAKRAVVQVDTMKDYIKFLLRGNKTKEDETNTAPYATANITLGRERIFVFFGFDQVLTKEDLRFKLLNSLQRACCYMKHVSF